MLVSLGIHLLRPCVTSRVMAFLSSSFFEGGKKRHFYQIGICSALKQLPQPAVQELSCDEGNVPRDPSGERSGWQRRRRSGVTAEVQGTSRVIGH